MQDREERRLDMPKQVHSAAKLRLCVERAEIPGGPAFEREFERSLHHQRLFLVKEELHRAQDAAPAPRDVFSRVRQALDLLLGRGQVWVERRRP